MNKGVKLLAVANLFLLFIGFVGVLAGCGGDSWWVGGEQTDYKKGLFKECVTYDDFRDENCEKMKTRDNILDFQKGYRDLDAMLLVLIISAITTFFGVINLFVLVTYCRHEEDKWTCASLLLTLNTFSAAVAAFGACIYAEVEFKDDFETYEHGWSIIFAWIGSCCLIISFILSFVLICNGPEESNPQEIMRTL